MHCPIGPRSDIAYMRSYLAGGRSLPPWSSSGSSFRCWAKLDLGLSPALNGLIAMASRRRSMPHDW